MATGQDREAEDTRIRQLRRVDPSVGTPSGTLAQGNTLRRRHRLGLRLGKDARQDASVWRNAGSGYLYPAAEHAGIIFRQGDGSYADSTGRKVTRFGFHNLRKAVSDYLNEGKKADVRTIQDTLRHEKPDVTLVRYTESSLELRLAAQDVMADAIFFDLKRMQ